MGNSPQCISFLAGQLT
uniref:Uncharacterized protein n=1 Tax=Rhizophora mucronata TaxID=61149 RepID=A0A2P2NXB8_RHIMU